MNSQDIYSKTLNNFGHSVSVGTGHEPQDGFCVALPGFEQIVPLSEFRPATIEAYVEKHAAELKGSDRLFGTWLDGGKVYLDISVVVPTAEAAEPLARKYKQLAFYDVKAGQSIDVR